MFHLYAIFTAACRQRASASVGPPPDAPRPAAQPEGATSPPDSPYPAGLHSAPRPAAWPEGAT